MKNSQSAIQEFLRNKLTELQSKNARFSLRSFASRLDLNSGSLSEILNGQRRISKKMTEKICKQLDLDPSQRVELLKNFDPAIKLNKNKNQEKIVHQLTSEQFQEFSSWIHFALLSLMNSNSFSSDPKILAERFNCKVVDVKKALSGLKEAGLISKNDLGEWQRTHKKVNTSDGVPNRFIRQSHLNDLKLIKEKLTEAPVEFRDYTSFTFPCNPDLMPKAKDIIRRAQEDLAELTEGNNQHEVYRVNMYLYPLTHFQKEKV